MCEMAKYVQYFAEKKCCVQPARWHLAETIVACRSELAYFMSIAFAIKRSERGWCGVFNSCGVVSDASVLPLRNADL